MITLKIDIVNRNVVLLNAMEDEEFSSFRQNCLHIVVNLTRSLPAIYNARSVKDYAKQVS